MVTLEEKAYEIITVFNSEEKKEENVTFCKSKNCEKIL